MNRERSNCLLNSTEKTRSNCLLVRSRASSPLLSRIRPDMNGDSGGGGGTISIRVPYRHLNNAELELVGLNGDPDLNSKPNGESQDPNPDAKPRISTRRLVLSCTVAAGVQFGWALQLSLLTPYIQVRFLFFFFLLKIYFQRFSSSIQPQVSTILSCISLKDNSGNFLPVRWYLI